MYLIPKSFLSLNPEARESIYILFVLELGELLPLNLQILALTSDQKSGKSDVTQVSLNLKGTFWIKTLRRLNRCFFLWKV